MNVLLVDDKESVVKGIEKHIDWNQLGVCQVVTAVDGKDALAKCLDLELDLVITDIKMPNMDGIELIAELKRTNNAAGFIVLSGYDEFEYAKQAMALGVSEYVLKPFDVNKLFEVIERVLADIRKNRELDEQREKFRLIVQQSLPALRGQYLNQMIRFSDEDTKRLIEKWNFAQIPLLAKNFQVLTVSVDQFSEILQLSVQEVELARFIVENIVTEVLGQRGNGTCFYSEWDKLTILLNCKEDHPKKSKKDSFSFAEECKGAIERHSKLTVNIGISSFCETIEDLPRAYQQASSALEHATFTGIHPIIHYEDISTYFKEDRIVYPTELEQVLMRFVRTGQVDRAETALTAFLQRLEADAGSPDEIRFACLQLVSVLYRLLLETDMYEEKELVVKIKDWHERSETANLPELRQRLTDLFIVSSQRMKHMLEASTVNLVHRAVEFIENNVDKSITLTSVADQFNVSPNYLSSLFKKETGVSFVEYLTDQKMNKAREWLLNPTIHIYEIAERLDYQDRRYFRELFKKKFGFTPSEYREMQWTDETREAPEGKS